MASKPASSVTSLRTQMRFLVGGNHTRLAREHEGTFYWFWIGSHEDYQRLIKR
ncbi:MAG TPA: hypothetical protein VGO68_04710 [Pyrinomonadaceae bacterium]|nr:hypothetical protein [Pyrinomonadaceae bacterium]